MGDVPFSPWGAIICRGSAEGSTLGSGEEVVCKASGTSVRIVWSMTENEELNRICAVGGVTSSLPQ